MASSQPIKAIDSDSVHRITSGQVVIDLQSAVKELVENSLDASATNIEVRFKEYGVKSFEVLDNGTGIAPEDYESIALKHHTSKLASFDDLNTVLTFGFRGEALSSLCALSQSLNVTTARAEEAPVAAVLEMHPSGHLKSKDGRVARQRGTTVTVTGLFSSLPVRRKEFERNAKREFAKAMALLNAYALVPCAKGVRLTVTNQVESGKKSVQMQTDGSKSLKACVTALWGPKALEKVVPLDLSFDVEAEKTVLRRQGITDSTTTVKVTGVTSSFAPGCGRVGTDRQFFYVNGRPCNMSKIQKAMNEVYRTFNTNQAPLVIADFQIPTNACDINVSPDKRTIFLHSEDSLVQAFKAALEKTFSSSRSTFTINNATNTGRSGRNEEESEEDELMEEAGPAGLAMNAPPNTPAPGSSKPKSIATAKRLTRPAALLITPTDPVEADNQLLFLRPSPPSTPTPEIVTLRPLRERSPPRPKSTPLPQESPPIPAVKQVKSSTKPIQTVLSTHGASWNLRRGPQDEVGGPMKKRRLDDQPRSASLTGDNARKNLKQKLLRFSSGSQRVADTDENRIESDQLVREPDKDRVVSVDEEIQVDKEEPAEKENPDRQAAQRVEPLTTDVNAVSEVIDLTDLAEDDIEVTEMPPGRRVEVMRNAQEEYLRRFDIDRVKRTWLHYKTRQIPLEQLRSPQSTTTATGSPRSLPPSMDNTMQDAKAAEQVLSMVVHKEDFAAMKVVGQFNLGFIITRRQQFDLDGMAKADDLFMVDQHASDEKYNFETLQQTTKIDSQRLFKARPLELSAADELVAIENVDVLRRNGFEVSIDEEAPARERVKLVAQPISKGTVFDFEDLEELLQLMQDQPAGQMVRCSKARRMFASRACRKSVMIGKPLSKPQMSSIVKHMGQLDQPWNCPHGRPTMRHLIGLEERRPKPIASIDWVSFMAKANAESQT